MRTLLIDDLRNILTDVTARTFQQGIDALKSEKFDILFLDHDLGEDTIEGSHSKTGYGILCWLEQHPEFLPLKIVLVTSNPVGRDKMQALLNRLYQNE